jgi:hypothetical protein
MSWRVDQLASAKYIKNNTDSLINLPDKNFATETRADISFKSDMVNAVLRPIFDLQIDNKDKNLSKRFEFSELYLSKNFSENHYFSIGKKNNQWGPSEFISWSNPLVHFNPLSKSFFYVEEGQNSLLYDYTPSERLIFSLVAKVLPKEINKNENEFIYDSKFKKEVLIRSEYTFNNNTDSIGATFSKTLLDDLNLGLYGKKSLTDSWSVYVDNRFSFSNENYILSYKKYYTSDFLTFKDVKSTDNLFMPFLNFGVRFESSFDYRLEFIYNKNGFNKQQLKLINKELFINNPFALNNLNIFKKRGSEFIGSTYLYHSLRIPDLGPKKNITSFVRHTYSLQDNSSNLQASFEYNYSDSQVWYLELQTFLGNKYSEFSSEGRFSFTVGPKISI